MRLFAVLLIASIAQAQQCSIPASVPATKPTRVDHANRNTPTDFYALALSWSPQFCSSASNRNNPANKFQCIVNRFGFVVHGLWPQSAKATSSDQHPRHCKAPEILPAAVSKPHLCTMPSAQLIQDEWIKHGTCAFPNAAAYLDRVEKLYNNLVKPDVSGLGKSTKGWSTSGAIRKAVVDANKAKGLKAEHTQVRVVSSNRFSEFMVCYDKQFKFTACGDPGTPDEVEVRISPKN